MKLSITVVFSLLLSGAAAQYDVQVEDAGQVHDLSSLTYDPFRLGDSWCVDLKDECEQLAREGKCLLNPRFMADHCRKSCKVLCGETVEEAAAFMGDWDPKEGDHALVLDVVKETAAYLKQLLLESDNDTARVRCKNRSKTCFADKAKGWCEEKPEVMAKRCALACQTCNQVAGDLYGQMDYDELTSEDFWNGVAEAAGTTLHAGGNDVSDDSLATTPLNDERTKKMRKKMILDGYLELDGRIDEEMNRIEKLAAQLRKAIEEIADSRSFLAQFLMVYDETWELINSLSRTLKPVFGLDLVYDFYVFNIKPGAEGTFIHRDRSGGDWKAQFQKKEPYKDQPIYTTIWFALTHANETTSSIYMIPAHADYDYRTYSVDPNFTQNDKSKSSVLRKSYRHIRHLPAKPGTTYVWSQRALHWSSAPPIDAPHSRQTLTFTMGKPNVEPPTLKHNDPRSPPPFKARLAAIAYCAIFYQYSFSHLEKDVLLQYLTMLADPAFADHLSDTALGPSTQFASTVLDFYDDPDMVKTLGDVIAKLAHYMIVVRGLEGSDEMRALLAERGLVGSEEMKATIKTE